MKIKIYIVKWGKQHVKKKKEIVASDVSQTPVVFPPSKTKTKKRIQPTLMNGATQQSPVFGSNGQTPGQRRMQNTVNRMEKHYSNPANNY